MNPFMSRISFFIIFFLFATIANNLNANGFSGYKAECSIVDSANPLNEQAPAVISATMTGSSSVCLNSLNQNISFTGMNGKPPYTFKYKIDGILQSRLTTGVSNSSVTIPINTTLAHDYKFTLDSVFDTTPDKQAQPVTLIVKVNDLPVVDFNFADNQCSDIEISFLPSIHGANSYFWDFGDGSTSTDENPKHTYKTLGCGTNVFTAKLTVTDSNGCTNTKLKPVTINQQPDINFEDANATGVNNQFNNCKNASSSNSSYSITVKNISTSTCASFTINWGDSSPVETNVSFPVSHNYTSLGTYNLIITGVGTNGCSISKMYLVRNVSNPSGGISSPGNTQNLCAPTALLEFSISGWARNSPGTTYKVEYGDGSVVNLDQSQLVSSAFYNASDPTESANYPVPHSYLKSSCPAAQYIVKLTVANPCGATLGTTSNITILSKPVASFTTDLTVCLNELVSFTNNSILGLDSGCDNSTMFTWDFGDSTPSQNTGYITSAKNTTHVYTLPGTYTVSLTAQNSCGDSKMTQQIVVNPLPTATISGATTVCQNSPSPLIIFTGANGTVPYTFTYKLNNSSYQYATTSSGNSSVTIPAPTNVSGVFTYVLVSVREGSPSACSQLQSDTVVVKINPSPKAIISGTTIVCLNTNPQPLITFTGSTGTAPYTFSYNINGGSTLTIKTKAGNSITIPQVTDVAGTFIYTLLSVQDSSSTACNQLQNGIATIKVNQSPAPLNLTDQKFCNGDITPVIPFSDNNTVPGTTFVWTNSNISIGLAASGIGNVPSFTATNTTSGPISSNIKVTPSANGCVGNVVNYVVIVNPSPTITNQPQSSQICQGGTVTPLTVGFAGLGIPSYQWYKNTVNDKTSGTAIPGEINATFNPPTAIVDTIYYYCAITFSGGGCSNLITNTASVGVNAIPVIKTQPTPSQTVCVGGTAAFPLSFVYTGGAGVVSYQWYSTSTNITTGGAIIQGATNKNYSPPAFTTPGTYYFYAEISFSGSTCGLILTDTAKIVVIPDPIVTTQPMSTQTLCQNSVPAGLSVVVSGGIEVFSYQWYSNSINNTTTGTKIINAVNSAFTPPTTTVGTSYFYCIVSQPNGPGCVVTSNSSEIIVTKAPTFTKQPASSTVCLGDLPDVLSITTINGTGTPKYQWYSNTKDSLAGGIAIPGATSSSHIAPSGTIGTMYYYCVAGFASVECSGITSNIAQITVNDNPVISTYSDVINSGEAFSVIPDNSNGDIVPVGTTYTWTILGISPLGSINGASSQLTPQTAISQTLTNLTTSIATVTYTATPNSGTCKGAVFNVIITVNPPLNPNITIKNISCFGMNDGSIKTAIQGGVPFKTGNPYTVSWTGPNGFTSAVNPIVNLKPGNYIITIKDSLGITITKTYPITQPEEITIQTRTNKNISCFGASNGEIEIEVKGGTEPYTYSWLKDAVPFSGSSSLTNLSPGKYTVSVTDKNLCGPKTSSFDIIQPTEIVVTIDKQVNITCFGDSTGSLSVGVAGGVPVENTPGVFGYTYSWTGPNGFVSTAKNLTNIVAGIYNLKVTDNTGCTMNFPATITQPDELKFNQVITPVTCYGENNASIKLNIMGGHPPYQIEWSNLGKGTFQDNLSPGTYTVLVTDSAGCFMSNDFVIDEAAFSIQPMVKQITCFGAHNGSIILNIRGGIKPLTLTWSDNPTVGNTRNQLGSGMYTVVITDASACVIKQQFTIIEPPKLNLSAAITNAFDCSNPNSGAINLIVSGGTEPYGYVWTNGKTTSDLSTIQEGKYGVTVTDAKGCSVDTVFEIIRPLPVTLSVKTVPDFDCLSHAIKEVSTAAALGGLPPYRFSWSNGNTSGLINEVMETTQSGIIILGVTDSRGCSANYTFNLSVPVPGIQSRTLNCDAHIIGFTAIIPTGLVGDYTYSWDFGDGKTDNIQNPLHTYDTPGAYKVSLILKNALCSSIYSVPIQVESIPVLVLDKLPVFCTGDSLLVHVSGAETYRWGDGSTGDNLLIKQAGDYLVTGASKQGCTSTLRFTSTNFEPYNYTIQSDRNEVTTQNSTLQLWSESISYSSYFWNFGDSIQADGNNQLHTYTILKDGYYDIKLQVKNPNGCMEYATKRIWITDASMGNVFSPGYDGVFLKGFHIQLYNRNGFLLYDGSGGWDGNYKGTPVSNDTYFYVLYLSGESGIKTKSGFVTVVR